MNKIHNISSKASRALKNEDGLSFIELILVSAFAVFIIILAYNLMQYAQVGQRQVNANAAVTGDTGVVLDILDRYLSQNTAISVADNYNFSLQIPDKSGGADYPVSFSSRDDGTFVMTRTMNGVTDSLVLSTNNANKISGKALLQYYDDQGKLLASLDSSHPLDEVRAVKITVVAKNPDSRSSDTAYLYSSRTVYFRNR